MKFVLADVEGDYISAEENYRWTDELQKAKVFNSGETMHCDIFRDDRAANFTRLKVLPVSEVPPTRPTIELIED